MLGGEAAFARAKPEDLALVGRTGTGGGRSLPRVRGPHGGGWAPARRTEGGGWHRSALAHRSRSRRAAPRSLPRSPRQPHPRPPAALPARNAEKDPCPVVASQLRSGSYRPFAPRSLTRESIGVFQEVIPRQRGSADTSVLAHLACETMKRATRVPQTRPLLSIFILIPERLPKHVLG